MSLQAQCLLSASLHCFKLLSLQTVEDKLSDILHESIPGKLEELLNPNNG